MANVTQDDEYEFDQERAFGWLLFAAAMLGLAGILTLFHGITALSKSSFYAQNAHFVFSDLRTWGWIMVVLGALVILAALTVLKGSGFARWFGIFAAALSVIAHFSAMQAYPFWSLVVIAIDLLVIYALAVYGGQKME